MVEFSIFCSEKPLHKQNGSLLLNVFARKIYQRPAMDLNRHTSSDESRGNLGAELCYYIWSSISFAETIISDFCSEKSVSDRNRKFWFRRKRCSTILTTNRPELLKTRNQLHATRGRVKSYRMELGDSSLEMPRVSFAIIRKRGLVTRRWPFSAPIRTRRVLAIFHSRHCEINFFPFF